MPAQGSRRVLEPLEFGRLLPGAEEFVDGIARLSEGHGKQHEEAIREVTPLLRSVD